MCVNEEIMRLKSELYAKEQTEIVDTIIRILSLDRENSTTLYELEHDEGKKKLSSYEHNYRLLVY